MAYVGYPFPESDVQESSYVHHSTVLEYLKSFAGHFDLNQYIKGNLWLQPWSFGITLLCADTVFMLHNDAHYNNLPSVERNILFI